MREMKRGLILFMICFRVNEDGTLGDGVYFAVMVAVLALKAVVPPLSRMLTFVSPDEPIDLSQARTCSVAVPPVGTAT